jgi:hypothetical protein
MNLLGNPLCAICGRNNSANQPRFLIAENSWEDKLTILQWTMASRPGIKAACSIEHVEELVIHWMTTGRLDYPLRTRLIWRGGLATCFAIQPIRPQRGTIYWRTRGAP